MRSATWRWSRPSSSQTDLHLVEEPLAQLLAAYPPLRAYGDWLAFLRATGGAHVHDEGRSLGIYGFEGLVVASFDEGLFLDRERWFVFGEALYGGVDEVRLFAFDLHTPEDVVLARADGDARYTACAPSFLVFLADFAAGRRPGLDR